MFPYHLRGEVEQRRSRRPEHVRCGVFIDKCSWGVTPFPSRTQRTKRAAGVSLWCGSFWCKNCACLQRERGHVLGGDYDVGPPPPASDTGTLLGARFLITGRSAAFLRLSKQRTTSRGLQLSRVPGRSRSITCPPCSAVCQTVSFGAWHIPHICAPNKASVSGAGLAMQTLSRIFCGATFGAHVSNRGRTVQGNKVSFPRDQNGLVCFCTAHNTLRSSSFCVGNAFSNWLRVWETPHSAKRIRQRC